MYPWYCTVWTLPVAETRVVAMNDGTVLDADLFPVMAEDTRDLMTVDYNEKSTLLRSAPFLAKFTAHLYRQGVPVRTHRSLRSFLCPRRRQQ
jgi:hypothetical protein